MSMDPTKEPRRRTNLDEWQTLVSEPFEPELIGCDLLFPRILYSRVASAADFWNKK
jgi:hypothetical protein